MVSPGEQCEAATLSCDEETGAAPGTSTAHLSLVGMEPCNRNVPCLAEPDVASQVIALDVEAASACWGFTQGACHVVSDIDIGLATATCYPPLEGVNMCPGGSYADGSSTNIVVVVVLFGWRALCDRTNLCCGLCLPCDR